MGGWNWFKIGLKIFSSITNNFVKYNGNAYFFFVYKGFFR